MALASKMQMLLAQRSGNSQHGELVNYQHTSLLPLMRHHFQELLRRAEAQIQELHEKEEAIERSITETLEKLRTLEQETAQEEKNALALTAEVISTALFYCFSCAYIFAYQWAHALCTVGL